MQRVAVIGNAGGGKSTLARRLAAHRGLPYCELDRLVWQPDWTAAPAADYEVRHEFLIAEDAWVIDGLGRRSSLERRLTRATEILFVDLPLWVHFWLAAERQMAWSHGKLAIRPGNFEQMPQTGALFRTIWQIDQDWMPTLRAQARRRAEAGIAVTWIETLEALTALQRDFGPPAPDAAAPGPPPRRGGPAGSGSRR